MPTATPTHQAPRTWRVGSRLGGIERSLLHDGAEVVSAVRDARLRVHRESHAPGGEGRIGDRELAHVVEAPGERASAGLAGERGHRVLGRFGTAADLTILATPGVERLAAGLHLDSDAVAFETT